jgi:sugar/nucleoside kinase (ribokinase family)
MPGKKSILCVGQLVADIVVRPVGGMPVPGRTDSVEDLQLLAGGCAANTAVVLAKLGARAQLAALIGQDSLGSAVLADLKATGVGLEAVTRQASVSTSAAIVLVRDDGERSFFYRDGGNELLANSHVADSFIKAASIMHVGGALKLLNLDLTELMNRAKAFGCTTSLDTDWDVHDNWMQRLQGALPQIDYLMTNEEEAAKLTGKDAAEAAARDLLARGPQAVVIKRGHLGAMLATRNGITGSPAYRVEVQDTTCAGDSFAAGFLLGLSRGWPLDESITLANAAGALCTTQLSHNGISSLDDLVQLIKAQTTSSTLHHKLSSLEQS